MSFYISKLWVTGLGVPTAELNFQPGLNIIDGPSNSGKSYAHHCLDFMTGASDVPENIKEAAGYTHAYIEIQDQQNNITYSLRRSLNGGDFTLAKDDLERFDSVEHSTLKGKHDSKKADNISQFLLDLCQFSHPFIKVNKQNTKRNLSFRDIARLTIIDEVEILKKGSPITSETKNLPKTEETSVFSYLITGKDFHDIIEIEDSKIRKGKIDAQLLVLQTLIDSSEEHVGESYAPDALVKVQASIQSHLNEIENQSFKREELEKNRKVKWDELKKIESEQALEEEIYKRFQLLLEQYDKDLKRLGFINEGTDLLSYLSDVRCPVCGRSEEHSHSDEKTVTKDIEAVSASIAKEYQKIQAKRNDLKQTIENLFNSIQNIAGRYYEVHEAIIQMDIEIRTILEPSMQFQKNRLKNLILEQNDILENTSNSTLEKLREKKVELLLALKEKTISRSDNSIDTSALKEFTDLVEQLLLGWKYAANINVYFDSKRKDIVINGSPRSSDGKGYRAITYSAFVIGLMKYSILKKWPNAGIIILDSPLTAYKKTQDFDPDIDTIPADIEEAFFEDLSSTSTDQQIIIFENKTVDNRLQANINYIHFTKNPNSGRFGFFPI